MNARLKSFLVEKFGLAAEADDATAKAMVSAKLKSGELDTDKYTELLAPVITKDKGDELAEKTAAAVTAGLAPAFAGIATALEGLGKAFTATKVEPTPVPKEEPAPPPVDNEKALADMEERLKKRLGLDTAGNDGSALMAMSKSFDETTPADIRVKSAVEGYSHNPQTLVYKSKHAKTLGIAGDPILYGHRQINQATERTKAMCAVWMKLQMFPESLNEREKGMVRYILHREKFHMPGSDETKTESRFLTEAERHDVLKSHLEFYGYGQKAAVLNETSGSGGAYAVPEFFDMDMIVAPTLAGENLAQYCHVIPVPRGSAAQNFVMGRPTIAAANETVTAVTPTAVFDPTGFITNHDTTFFRAAGFIELGRNFIEDAHPGLVAEIQNQYMNSVRLWFNEQITNGDGTTEPQGIKNASGTADITPTTPTAGPILLSDAFRMLFGVNKAYREDGGRGNAIYIGTDTTYSRLRAIATGVTGDTRLVFGEDVESYRLFGHPFLVEEQGMENGDLIFAQMKGYRLYLRQGARFIREDRGDTLVRRNTFLIGVDVRAGGQLDLGPYASVADSLPA